MAHNRKDLLWKDTIKLFSKDFVRFFYPNADQIFDLDKEIEFLDTELSQKSTENENLKDASRVDGLLKVPARSPVVEFFILMVEVHGYNRYNYPQHIFTNFSRLLDKYPDRLTVKIIYTETSKNFNANSFNYALLGLRLAFDFDPYIIRRQKEDELENHPNPFALVILTVLLFSKQPRSRNDNWLFSAKIRLLQNLKKRDLPPEQEYNLLIFIRLYLDFVSKEMRYKFDQQIRLINLKEKTMTLTELFQENVAYWAKKDGIEEKNTSVIKNLLLKGKLTLEEIADVAEVTLDFVKSIRMQLNSPG